MWTSRHAGVYVLGSGMAMLLSLVSVAVLTAFLDPAEFGQLALLLILATLLSTAYTLGTLHGTMMKAYGSTGEEDDEDEAPRRIPESQKRRLLGTGLTVIAAVAALGTLAAVPALPLFAELLLGDRSDADLVLMAIATGAIGSVWSFLLMIPRLELRPVTYVVLVLARAIFIIAAVVPLVATGHGVGGAIGGTALGSGIALLGALLVFRGSIKVSPTRAQAKMLFRKGRLYVLIVIAFWLMASADLLMVSRYLPDEEVGFYRLAAQIATIVSYATSAILLAWTPLARTELFLEAEREGAGGARAEFLTFFTLLCMGLLVAMSVAAETLVRIAPSAYSQAAPLIPLLAGALMLGAIVQATYRTARFPRKRRSLAFAAGIAAVIMLATSPVLIPLLGGSGAAVAVILGFAFGATWLTWRSQRGDRPLPLKWDRLAAGAAITIPSLVAVRLATGLDPPAQTVVQIAILAAFPALLTVTGAVPMRQWRRLREIGRQAFHPTSEVLDIKALRASADGPAKLDVTLQEADRGGDAPTARTVARARPRSTFRSSPPRTRRRP